MRIKNKLKKETRALEKSGNRKSAIIALSIATGTAAVLYIILGAVASIIKNPFFTRMTPVGWLEMSSLLITSLLIGAYIGLLYYGKASGKDKACNASAATGGVFGFLTFGCPICNRILVFLLGITGVLTYFEPLRPSLGILSVGLLSFAIFKKSQRSSSMNIIK
ncbi:hypothetical protein HYW20_04335 [Candidatus Woesearchaeota archaeon]|nr:hypothetical protein [Candidatus Woesearchaeota archaeon]